MIYGLQPGPLLIKDHPDLFWGVVSEHVYREYNAIGSKSSAHPLMGKDTEDSLFLPL